MSRQEAFEYLGRVADRVRHRGVPALMDTYSILEIAQEIIRLECLLVGEELVIP